MEPIEDRLSRIDGRIEQIFVAMVDEKTIVDKYVPDSEGMGHARGDVRTA